MSGWTYYEERDAKVAMAHELMKRGWEVFGYHKDESDFMVDYYSPSWWDGLATKNGYVLVVDKWADGKEQIITSKKYTYNENGLSVKQMKVIEKLEALTVERGATESEEKSAKEKIKLIKEKAQTSDDVEEIKMVIPSYQKNPNRMKWHIEKDGVILDKGNNIKKFADMKNFDIDSANRDLARWINYKDLANEFGSVTDYHYTVNECQHRIDRINSEIKLHKSFMKLMDRIESNAGFQIGKDGYVYEKVEVVEMKKEKKVVETANGSFKNGQCIVLKARFNYGCSKGNVYKIVANSGGADGILCKLNKKMDKVLTGTSNASNTFGWVALDGRNYHNNNRILNWIEKGYISWCDIVEVETPIKKIKMVKRKISC